MEDILRFLEEIEPILAIIARIMREYLFLIIVFVFLMVLIRVIRKWPDRAQRVFREAGVKVTEQQVRDLRGNLADIAADAASQTLRAINQQKLKIESIRQEREKIKHLIWAAPLLVREVGEAVLAVEKEYLSNIGKVKSDSAKETLRLASERGIKDIVQSISSQSNDLPPFRISDK